MTTCVIAAATSTAPSALGIDWSILGIVLAGVALLMFMIRLLGLSLANESSAPSAKQLTPTRSNAAAPEPSDAIEPELVAVLAAAASVALDGRVRVLSVSEVAFGNVQEQRAWAQEGRREVYLSHRIR
jgi:Na+-transporting methylmalonyl-CoA/oxaloacetate decarboxylase gamma subunit